MARRKSLQEEWAFESSSSSGDHSVSIDLIVMPTSQPRRYFDAEKLQQLTESVRQHGILEPLLVRPSRQPGVYELIAGERRLRAAKQASLSSVPVIVREFNDEEALQIALVENLQREDLNPVEEAEGILQLLGLRLNINSSDVPALLYRMRNEVAGNSKQNILTSPDGKTVQAVFHELGTLTWESFVTTRLPLLNLPTEILEVLRSGQIAYTKAQIIARIKDDEQRRQLLEEAIANDLSFLDIKERIANLKADSAKLQNSPPSLKNQIDDVLRLAKRSQVWNNPRKQKRLEKLLGELRTLVAEAN